MRFQLILRPVEVQPSTDQYKVTSYSFLQPWLDLNQRGRHTFEAQSSLCIVYRYPSVVLATRASTPCFDLACIHGHMEETLLDLSISISSNMSRNFLYSDYFLLRLYIKEVEQILTINIKKFCFLFQPTHSKNHNKKGHSFLRMTLLIFQGLFVINGHSRPVCPGSIALR